MPQPLRAIAHSRTGDKGDTLNIAVIAYHPKDYARLERHVTAERVKAHFADRVRGEVHRYALPSLGALNFVLHGAGRRRDALARPRCARQVPQLRHPGSRDPGQ